MRFGIATLAAVLVASATTTSIDAFSVAGKRMQQQRMTAAATTVKTTEKAQQHQLVSMSNSKQGRLLLSPSMQMVAGGAERAYGDDYYDGELRECVGDLKGDGGKEQTLQL
jgi:hypothetical protein